MLTPSIYPVTCHTDHVGPGSTFVAIKGFRDDGTTYITQALAKGATTIVVEPSVVNDELQRQCAIAGAELRIVPNTRKALAELSSAALNHPWQKLTIIGVTGTKGKTTTTYLIEHMLREAGYKTAILGTICNRIIDQTESSKNTTPESDYLHIFFNECLKRGVTHVVMEVSSHSLSLHRVHGMAFDALGFTNLGSEHMDFYDTLDNYFAAKAMLFSHLKPHGSIIINTDDVWGQRACIIAAEHQKNTSGTVISMGQNQPTQRPSLPEAKYIQFIMTKSSFEGVALSLGTSPSLELSCSTFFGSFNCYNISMASIICRCLGLSDTTIKHALTTFSGVPGRLQRHALANGAYAFVDYAHNPSSFHEVLTTLRPHTSNLIVVFGCGGGKDRVKRPLMGQIAATHGDTIILTDDNPRYEDRNAIINEIVAGIPASQAHKIIIEPNRRTAIQLAATRSSKNSIIALLGKGHETYYSIQGNTLHFDDMEEIRKF